MRDSGRVKELGQFYTIGKDFLSNNVAFQKWVREHHLENVPVLEPFAGRNDLIRSMSSVCQGRSSSFDIDPQISGVVKRDTLINFPTGHRFCVTNPPWLCKSSASRRRIKYEGGFSNLYKDALGLCLKNCEYVAILLPASFFQQKMFKDRLEHFVLLEDQHPFIDTDTPSCLALFSPKVRSDFHVWRDNHILGLYTDLVKTNPQASKRNDIVFNAPDGNLGLLAMDGTSARSIRFCHPREVTQVIKPSSRVNTRIYVKGVFIGNRFISLLNALLSKIRRETHDLFLTPSRGIMKSNGQFRRRLRFNQASTIISLVLQGY